MGVKGLTEYVKLKHQSLLRVEFCSIKANAIFTDPFLPQTHILNVHPPLLYATERSQMCIKDRKSKWSKN